MRYTTTRHRNSHLRLELVEKNALVRRRNAVTLLFRATLCSATHRLTPDYGTSEWQARYVVAAKPHSRQPLYTRIMSVNT